MEDPLQVEVEYPVPRPGVVIFEWRSPGGPCVVYEHIERLPALFHRVGEPPASLLAREVLGNRDAFADPGQLLRHRSAYLGLAAADQDRSTVLHERLGDHQPNAGGAPGDDHTLALYRKQLARTHPHTSQSSYVHASQIPPNGSALSLLPTLLSEATPQLALEYLAGGVARQVFHEEDVFGALEVRQLPSGVL